MIKIPLFPLNMVVLPFEEVPLHIFEPRYKRMIKDSIENNTPFGIVLNNNGNIDSIGCSLDVTKVIKHYETGEYDLIATGKKCFQIIDKVKEKELWVGDIEYMEAPIVEDDKLLKKVQNKYLELLIKLGKEENKIDIEKIDGSGKDGRILKGDLINLMDKSPKPSERKIKYGPEERIKMTRLRKTEITKERKKERKNERKKERNT